MAKMRKFLFWNESGDEKEKEALSLKKAVMSVQGDFKDKVIGVEYVSKKGNVYVLETIFDTKTGKVIDRKRFYHTKYGKNKK